ncbi:TetR family transcriptional regulator [Mycobacterium gordonae]|uniref:TetR family transcriptional regulator n=1 Tax=Mycobacterium gordonae TaxID=1778 RepID=A0A0Q2X963_MYCGO|nr:MULTISPECIES: TetR/AcrR family transcriptional regulator [Mycobacterium]KQH77708.1 TetR family transcriptional regulator [Mycobacterium gordonae]MDP7729644.1 TetR/AcrR family transcriptional regulator [Mycobacterium sp. TY813]
MEKRQITKGLRTGGRSARVRQAVLAATLDELVGGGYAALSVDAVASRAGVNKTTVYRRWPTLDDLVVDALTTWSLEALPAPDTGNIETDLLALGNELATALNGGVGRQVVAMVLTAGLRSPQLSAATRRYFDYQAERAIPLVAQAIDRGELPATCDANALLTTFRAPLFYRMVTTGEPIDEALIARAVSVALHAARAGLLSSD